jgi:hypothetical protein
VKTAVYIIGVANTAAPNLIKILIVIFFLAFAPILLVLLMWFHQYKGAAMQIAPL